MVFYDKNQTYLLLTGRGTGTEKQMQKQMIPPKSDVHGGSDSTTL